MKPFVSIIIPVYNNLNGLSRALEGLKNQAYPPDRYEVIVVDNGSTDGTLHYVLTCSGVQSLEEQETQGSYAARNKGIRHSRGQILAFLDSDCVPLTDWLAEGVAALNNHSGDLAAGKVLFKFSQRASASEYYDAICNIRNEESARSRGVGFTANLFVRKEVLTHLGSFPQHFRSGGDVFFTALASASGYNMVYAERAVVKHSARGFSALLRKMLRTGRGKVAILREATLTNVSIQARVKPLRFLSNINPLVLIHRLKKEDYRPGPLKFIRIIAIAFIVSGASGMGALFELLLTAKRGGSRRS